MKKFSSLFLLPVFIGISAAMVYAAGPVISLSPVSPNVICSTGNDTLLYSVTASGLPANTNVVIYQYTDSVFNPYTGTGDSIGFIPGASIPKDTVNFGSCVKILGILIDACGASGTEPQNEYIILTSGSGIKVSNLAIDFSPQNNAGATNADINTGVNPCGYKVPDPALITSLQAGSCNASNVIPANPGDSIPANAVILVFTSDSVNTNYNINGLCNLNHPVYVLQSSCLRTIGAFTNASNCGGTRYRTTTAIDKNQNCSSDFIYDLCNIFNKDGTYAIRQNGLDTASVANNGIRRNLIDSCGGLDYSQFNFSADTILKYRIPQNFCNTGFHYLKAITHPNGSQPVSNAISYKLVCNNVAAQTSTTTICSGDSALITISTTDQNAALSWTVSGGTNITGATAGIGNIIKQQLTYNGSTKDSVTYIVSSNDAGCVKTQTVKVVVQTCTVSACDSWLYTEQLPSYATCGDLDIVGDKVTVECMFNKNPNTFTPHLVSKHQLSTAVNYAIGPIHAEITTTNNGYVLLTAPCPPDSFKTYHVAMVYDGASLKYYRDGFLVASTPCSGNLITNDILTTIGQINAGTGPLYEQHQGYINEVRIWNVARTQQELRTYMNASLPNPNTQAGLKGYWVFNNLLNKQGDAQYNATLGGSALINQTNPQCTFTADSCSNRIVVCNPTITGNVPFCNGDSIVLDAGAGFTQYTWSNGKITQTIVVKSGGKYVVSVVGAGGCTGKDSVDVTVKPIPQVSISGTTSICPNGQTALTASGVFDSLRWNTNETTASINVSVAQGYSVTVYQNGCSNSSAVQVSLINPPAPFSLGNDTAFCGNFSKILSTGIPSTQWSTGATAAQITVSAADTYIATITNTCGTVSDTIILSKNDLPVIDIGNDTAFCEGQLVLKVSWNFRSIVWSTGSQDSIITVTADGTYSVTVTDGNGCSNTDQLTITSNCANQVFIPNAFSPNGDGINDIFLVRGNPRNTTIEKFIIYNRAGNKVFEANNVSPGDVAGGWDGKYKGEPDQVEVYGYYVIAKFSNGEKKILKGSVTLLR